MEINYSINKNLENILNVYSKSKDKELLNIDGIGDQLDVVNFKNEFFKNKVSADSSIDSNSNVSSISCLNYGFESNKPQSRLLSYNTLYNMYENKYGKDEATQVILNQLDGDIYINDFSNFDKSYCFNFSTYDIAVKGLEDVVGVEVKKAKSLFVFLRQVEQFLTQASNSIMGATGIADILITSSCYVQKIIDTGYDHTIKVEKGNIHSYIKEMLCALVYTLNTKFRGNQSSFTNISLYDKYFLESLCPDYCVFDEPAKIETVQLLQRLFVEVMNEEMQRTALTFPITTACFSVDNSYNIKDKDFLNFISYANLKYGFINIYCGKESVLSSCCRLRSNTEYFNSFGAGNTKIGSIGVVTINLPKLANKLLNYCHYHNNTNIKELFIKQLTNLFNIAVRINDCKRDNIKKYIKIDAQPLYNLDYIDIDKQYSTCGLVGIYESLEILGFNILEDDGQNFLESILLELNKLCDKATTKYKYPHNIEQIPAEGCAVTLAQKDSISGYNTKYKLYSNQFIPLIVNTDMINRINLQGRFDKLFSGGSICHINVNEQINDPKDMQDLITYSAKCGVIYFAINYKLNQCINHHLWVGGSICPVCGEHVNNVFTRVNINGTLI